MTNPRNPAMDNAQVTQRDIDAWEIYGPKIFNCEMTGPEALARHRLERSEPVGWMYDGPDGQHYINEHRDCAAQQLIGWGWTETPLYTTPPEPVAEIERLREALEPFALMHREGVAQPHSDRPKYTTVTTCIAYFERAAAALGDAS